MKNTIEIITVGNEILIGHTLDTNSNWIAKQATRRGWTVQRVTQLRDTVVAIGNGVRESVRRTPTILVTIGGLGPTHDDMTLKGIARALRRPLILNGSALDMIRKRYKEIEGSPPLTTQRKKMATLPKGADPVPNPIGTAPGVMTRSGRTRIFSLPGVPSEMKAIFNQSIGPVLGSSRTGPPQEAYLFLAGIVESALAHVLSRAQRKFPGLYFKSHPRGKETGVSPLVQLHIYTLHPRAKGKIPNAAAYLLSSLSRLS